MGIAGLIWARNVLFGERLIVVQRICDDRRSRCRARSARKSPLRKRIGGHSADLGGARRRRKPSQLANQNILSREIFGIGTADRDAILILPEGTLAGRCGWRRIVGIELVVAKVLIAVPCSSLRAGFDDHRDVRAHGTSELGAGVGGDLELLQASMGGEMPGEFIICMLESKPSSVKLLSWGRRPFTENSEVPDWPPP